MVSFATLSRTVLLSGCIALFASMPALAQPAPKPSKPLKLSGFAKPLPSRSAARPEPIAPPQPEPPLTTATVEKNATSRLNSGDAAAVDQRESDAAQFCKNIVDAALDARVAWQQKELDAAEAKLRQRIAELEAKRAEYEKWLKLRDEFLKKAEDSVVEIYSRMNPDAAAQQIAAMTDDTAAAVLAKIRARNASAILNEMEPARAAHLADTLAGMRRTEDGKAGK